VNDEKLRAAYETHLLQRVEHRADCVAPEALLALVEQRASEAERLQTLRHVSSCRLCRADLDLLRSTRAAAEQASAPPLWRNKRLLAAAAVLLFAGGTVIWQNVRGVEDLPRAGASNAPRLLAPAEEVKAAGSLALAWSALPSAQRYEVEILRSTGEVVFASTTRDTVLNVPANALAAGVDYRWWVVAVLPEGTRASPTRRLRITAP
jgi:hypothetical protein